MFVALPPEPTVAIWLMLRLPSKHLGQTFALGHISSQLSAPFGDPDLCLDLH